MRVPRWRSRPLIDIIGVGLMATIVVTVGSWLAVGRAVATTPHAGGAGPAHRARELDPLAGNGLDLPWAHADAVVLVACGVLIGLTLLVTLRHGHPWCAQSERQPLPTTDTGRPGQPTTSTRPPTSTLGGIEETSPRHVGQPGIAATTGRKTFDPTPDPDP